MNRQELLAVAIPFLEAHGFEVKRAKIGLLKSLYGPSSDFFSVREVQIWNAMVYVYWRKHLLSETINPPNLIHFSLSPDGTKTSNKRLLKQLARLASKHDRVLTGLFDPSNPESSPKHTPGTMLTEVPQPLGYMTEENA